MSLNREELFKNIFSTKGLIYIIIFLIIQIISNYSSMYILTVLGFGAIEGETNLLFAKIKTSVLFEGAFRIFIIIVFTVFNVNNLLKNTMKLFRVTRKKLN